MEQNSDEQSRPGLIRRFILPSLIILGVIWSMAGESIRRQTAEYLITSDSLEPADAIVVLGGIAAERAIEAADLYTEGYAPYIVLTPEEWHSGKTYDILKSLEIKSIESYEFSREVAVKLGVPVEAILVVDSRANSTRSEARGLKPFLLKNHIRSIIAVSSATHTTRTGIIFNWIFDGQIQVRMRPTKYDTFDPGAWWDERWMARSVLLEYMKLVDLYIAMALGNP